MPRIEHFALFAADPKALADFYIRHFGLRIVQDNSAMDPPGYFLADEAATALEIIGRPAGTPAPETRHICHVAFEVEDVQAARSSIEAEGVPFESDSAVATEAFETVFFRDPEGNRAQLVRRARPLVD